MDDVISRQAAIDALGERPVVWSDNDDYTLGARNQYDMDRLAIETVPSAQQWIPCKTALPEKENIRVTTQTNSGSVIIDCVYGGTDVYGHHVWRDGKGGLYWDDEIVAWMPIVIPEPWKGDTP